MKQKKAGLNNEDDINALVSEIRKSNINKPIARDEMTDDEFNKVMLASLIDAKKAMK